MSFSQIPEKKGLYDPQYEKDACGVGMVCNLSGEASHQTIKDGLDILVRLSHRGACGCDEQSGDGAGILVALPDKFFRRTLKENQGIDLPPRGRYAAGLVFLPREFADRQLAKQHIQSVVESYGQKFVTWRPVPTNNKCLGVASGGSEPAMEMMFVEAGSAAFVEDEAKFCTILYVIRRQIAATYKKEKEAKIYICSLSPRTIIYKGQLTPAQVDQYFIDLGQRDFESHVILVHSRFSTNTFPSWERAQPLRCIAHNGEINTLKGNTNWMASRQGSLDSKVIGGDLSKFFPIIDQDTSDSGAFDNVLEMLVHSGRDITEAISMMIPEPWQNDTTIDPLKKAYYQYQSCLIEPWDGPALMVFTDGRKLGAVLDRNGLRPGRFYVTNDNRVILSSEVGVLGIPDSSVVHKGALTPGQMFLIDFDAKRLVPDREIKHRLASARPYATWLKRQQILLRDPLAELKTPVAATGGDGAKPPAALLTEEKGMAADHPFVAAVQANPTGVMQRLKMFGYTVETLQMLVGPMGVDGFETLGSMGNDLALPALSRLPRHTFDYFQQLFAQVTNPPIDPIRESIVMSLACPIGPEGNLLEPSESLCHRVMLEGPCLTPQQFEALTHITVPGWRPTFLDMTFARAEGPAGLQANLRRLCEEATAAIRAGAKLLVLSDRTASKDRVPISSLLAVGAVHQNLVSQALRTQVGLIVECGDACEVHHHCVLLGFGVDAVYPYGALDAISRYFEEAQTAGAPRPAKLSREKIALNYQNATHKGLLKVISKMGISTIQSYKGAQIFEAVGVHKEVIDLCFTGCASRIGGAGFEILARDLLSFHEHAFPLRPISDITASTLRNPGDYHWRSGDTSELHLNSPEAIAALQEAARTNSRKAYLTYARKTNKLARACTLRGQLKLRKDVEPIPLEQVEPAKNIVKRFASGAMSYGSISIEAHSTLAIAMNRVGGRSNTGEGGEHISRYTPSPSGDSTRSAIKQVASGRFGVTIHYLTNSDEIQIKMAQGAKPGEGGELPGYKVVGEIAKTRHSTPGVGLISPPPHHDIYSIEDLAQLIFDLKNANPRARISVKLVSEVGVGVVAAGVAKGKADHILISGHDGGTGASKWTGIKHAGLPWELGLAEAHQTLVMNNLRGRVVLQTDGQLKTGLDVVKAALLGAEEFCFATAPLIALGCIMMRKCHLNTCPVGIATQDPELRKMFSGQPEHVVNFLFMVAEEARMYMARLGIREFKDLVGRSDLMVSRTYTEPKFKGLDLSPMLVPAFKLNPAAATSCVEEQNVSLEDALDRKIIRTIASDVRTGKRVRADFRIHNTDRTVGTLLSYEVTRKWGVAGLPTDTIHLRFKGSAGQSFGAWLAPGLKLELNGDANDYVGKGLSGGKIIVYPPKGSGFKSEENVIVGNVVLYGATSGWAFFRGRASQRFAVRNSGASAVVEGLGDHGCEYMTGGTIVVLGSVGRNFAAGMSGGIAYVYDPENQLPFRCNMGLVQLEKLEEEEDIETLKSLIDLHRTYTGSSVADRILWNWDQALTHFVKVIPSDYKAILTKRKAKRLLAAAMPAAAAPAPAAPLPGAVPPVARQLLDPFSREGERADPLAPAAFVPVSGLALRPTSAAMKEKEVEVQEEAKEADFFAPNPPEAEVAELEVKEKVADAVMMLAPAAPGPLMAVGAVAGSSMLRAHETAAAAAPARRAAAGPVAGPKKGGDLEDLAASADACGPSRPVKVDRPSKKRGFVEYERGSVPYRPEKERLKDFKEIYTKPEPAQLKTQSARCMDCGVPFCHEKTHGCPLGNKIPEWNDLVFKDQWKQALERLLETNNFPEFTGRVCPAPCEGACVLGITEQPVTIKNIENEIIDRAWAEGWMIPRPPPSRTGKKIVIVGSGPAGLACADQLNKAGHWVTVLERADRIGGLLMYGVPNMKLDKRGIVDRRVDLMRNEGVTFKPNTSVGKDVQASALLKQFDALVFAVGATRPRDLPLPGRELKGVHFAMDYLTPAYKSYLDSQNKDGKFLSAQNKRVIVIGGGDTGTDCLATALRQGAKSVINFELLPRPPATRAPSNPWPQWPRVFRVEYGHSEAAVVSGGHDPREYQVLTKRFLDDSKGNVSGVETIKIEWVRDEDGRWAMKEVEGSSKIWKADMVLLAMGFLGPETLCAMDLQLEVDALGNFKAPMGKFTTSHEKVFAAGDCRRGQSLVVWAIAEGRQCAREVDRSLMGSTLLP